MTSTPSSTTCALYAPSLPDELWAMIFVHLLPPDECNSDHQIFEGSTFQWVVSKVCKQWRYIVINTSVFWTDLQLSLRSQYTEGFTQLVKTCIPRSKSAPLQVAIYGRSASDFDGHTEIEDDPVLSFLVAQSHRWEFLAIYLMFERPIPRNLAAVRGNLPLLRTLTIGNDNWPPMDNSIPDSLRDIFGDTPLLSELNLRDLPTPCFKFDVCRIAELSIRNMPETAYDLLQKSSVQAPSAIELLRLDWEIEDYIRANVADNEVLTLIGVQEMHLSHSFDFVRHLTLPALEYLCVDDVFEERETDVHDLTDFVTRSLPPLRALDISIVTSQEKILGLLASIPSVESLTLMIGNGKIGSLFFRSMLYPSAEGGCILPNLKLLKLCDSTAAEEPNLEDALVGFLQSRRFFDLDLNGGSTSLGELTAPKLRDFTEAFSNIDVVDICVAHGYSTDSLVANGRLVHSQYPALWLQPTVSAFESEDDDSEQDSSNAEATEDESDSGAESELEGLEQGSMVAEMAGGESESEAESLEQDLLAFGAAAEDSDYEAGPEGIVLDWLDASLTAEISDSEPESDLESLLAEYIEEEYLD
ncbi:hypothetical protein HGRIS_011505 [Hohenbuehelia grisea]|uniref:F-box domain-containing protein n=1 Tax=Hohenbuehelia grisea TaxID=104357 RepID=A0ABR3JWA3_9AGAR